MTSTSKNVYIDKLDNIVSKYNNAYQSTIKMNPVDVKLNTKNDYTLCLGNALQYITINNMKSRFKRNCSCS